MLRAGCPLGDIKGGMYMNEITADETAQLLESEEILMVDVREHFEVVHGKIPNIIHIPLGELQARLHELNKKAKYVIVCRSGNRSGVATQFLNSLGYNVLNMAGGMHAWKGKVVTTALS